MSKTIVKKLKTIHVGKIELAKLTDDTFVLTVKDVAGIPMAIKLDTLEDLQLAMLNFK